MSDTAAPVYDLQIPQGSTFTRSFVWKDANGAPIPLTDFSARLQIRENFDSEIAILSLDSGIASAEGSLEITEAAGKITLVITDEATAAFDFDAAIWDMEVESPTGDVTRLVQGSVMLDREVTR